MAFNQKEYYKKIKNNPEYKLRRKGYNKKYYQKHKEQIKKRVKKYSQKNKRKVKECKKKYYEKHKNTPKYKLETKEYYQEHKEKIRKCNQERRGERKIYIKKWRRKNIEHIKIYNNKNKKRQNENNKKWLKTEKGKINSKKYNIKRRALKKKAKDTLTKKELKIIQDRDKKCIYCGTNKNLSFEHIISLKKGGENSFLNGVMACISCNSSKGDKDVFEWCKSKSYKVPKIVIKNLKLMEMTG